MQKLQTQHLTRAAAVGAAYAVLSLFSSVFSLTFGVVQCRFSEALCVLPFFFPETVWGLFAGCLITNLLSPYGLLDLIVGSLATLIAALLTARCRKKWLAPLPPVVLNTLLVGAVIAYEETGLTAAFPATWAIRKARAMFPAEVSQLSPLSANNLSSGPIKSKSFIPYLSYRIKFVVTRFSCSGSATPAALPACMHFMSHAMFSPR